MSHLNNFTTVVSYTSPIKLNVDYCCFSFILESCVLYVQASVFQVTEQRSAVYLNMLNINYQNNPLTSKRLFSCEQLCRAQTFGGTGARVFINSQNRVQILSFDYMKSIACKFQTVNAYSSQENFNYFLWPDGWM